MCVLISPIIFHHACWPPKNNRMRHHVFTTISQFSKSTGKYSLHTPQHKFCSNFVSSTRIRQVPNTLKGILIAQNASCIYHNNITLGFCVSTNVRQTPNIRYGAYLPPKMPLTYTTTTILIKFCVLNLRSIKGFVIVH